MTNIVFDQYQRYRFLQQIIDTLSNGKSARILEVGAAFSPLRTLLKDHSLIGVDRVSREAVNVRASGFRLPFRDKSFEIVISTDALEHMLEAERITLIGELTRVALNAVVLGFPGDSKPANDADRAFSNLIRKLTGSASDYLTEHLEYGLPDANAIQEILRPLFPEILKYSNANIHSWLLLQIANFLMLRHSDLDLSRGTFNAIFNEFFESVSHEPPFYRVFFACLKSPISPEMRQQLQEISKRDVSFESDQYVLKGLSMAAAVSDVLEEKERTIHVLQEDRRELQKEVSNLKANLTQLQKQTDAYRQQFLDLKARNENLQDYLDLFLNHPAYKVYRFAKQILNRTLETNSSPLVRDIQYQIFQDTFEPTENELRLQSKDWIQWTSAPILNLITAVYSPPFPVLQKTIQSVLDQTYGNWVWNIADASEEDTIWKYLLELSQSDPRIRTHRLKQNGGISNNTNFALQNATGDYIVMLDHDDTIAPNALYEVAKAIRAKPDTDFLYSDADKLDEEGNRCEPLFKPDWSPEMMLCCNLLNQLSVFRRTFLDEVGYLNPQLDGAQDWDLYLRISEKTARIHHIPHVLYHWRKSPTSTAVDVKNKPYAKKSQLETITGHLLRLNLQKPEVQFDPMHIVFQNHPLSRWDYKLRTVSIIIPSRDQLPLLKRCLESVLSITDYPDFEIILVDTGSTNKTTWSYYDSLSNQQQFHLIRFNGSFNFSKACNLGAEHATGELLLFLNNDTEVLDPPWLGRMVQWFEFSQIGVVGPKLIFPNGKNQHAGVILGLGGIAANLFRESGDGISSLFGSDCWYRNVSAVTGACLLIRRTTFEKAGGFDEDFQLNYSDVDLCLKVREQGYRILFTPEVRLIHHEAITTQKIAPTSDFILASQKWKDYLAAGDPYYNPNLSYRHYFPTFKKSEMDHCSSVNAIVLSRLPVDEKVLLPEDLPL